MGLFNTDKYHSFYYNYLASKQLPNQESYILLKSSSFSNVFKICLVRIEASVFFQTADIELVNSELSMFKAFTWLFPNKLTISSGMRATPKLLDIRLAIVSNSEPLHNSLGENPAVRQAFSKRN